VSAKSSTGKTAAKPLRGLDLETAERVVDVARIDTGIVSSDLMGLPPQRLGMSHERALRTRKIAERLRLVQIKRLSHIGSMPWLDGSGRAMKPPAAGLVAP
jgi:hypothetical protein